MHKKLLFGVLLLALLIRLIGLSNHPSGFTPDEASFGYDAYSIIKTGRDQWGNTLPLTFKSFGDGKLPLYTYLAIPSVAMFGLTEFAVRFPNAILGSFAVLVVYFLVLESLKDKKTALLSAFLLAISPWHIPMSRGAFEANLTTFLLPLAILAFIKGTKNSKYFILSAIFFGLNLFTYHSARLITPLIFLFLFFSSRKKIKFNLHTKTAIILLSIFVLLTAYTYLSGAGSRLSSVSILSLSSQAGPDRYNAVMVGLPDILARLFNNKATKLFSIFTSNYLSYFSPQFLFTQGPAEGTYGMLPGRGVLYLTEALFILGFFWMLVLKRSKIPSWLIFWLLVSPIPAALSIGPGYAANRATIMMPAIQIIASLGLIFLLTKFTRYKKFLILTFSFLLIFEFVFFGEDYFIQQPAQRSKDMIYGALEVSDYLESVEDQYDHIIISKSISEAHIFIAFTKKMDPTLYQKEAKNWDFDKQGLKWVDQMPIYSLGKYTFKSLDWKNDSRIPGILAVGRPEEFPENTVPEKKIYYPNNKEAFWIVSNLTKVFAQK